MAKKAGKGSIAVLPKNDTQNGYHVVLYAENGDLNGKVKRFRIWDNAVKFARKLGKEWGVRPFIQK